MPFCTTCGAQLTDGSQQCPSCSAGTPAFLENGSHNEEEVLIWSRKIPLITNTILIRDTFLAFMGAMFLVTLILFFITGDFSMFVMFLVISLGLFGLCLIIMLVLQVTTGGGLETQFGIGPGGVVHHAGRTTRVLNRGSTAGSAVLGSAGGTGAGFIAMSQEDNLLAWEDVRYVRVYTKLRFIELRSKWLISPVVLYCTEENFSAVLRVVNRFVPKTASVRIK